VTLRVSNILLANQKLQIFHRTISPFALLGQYRHFAISQFDGENDMKITLVIDLAFIYSHIA